MVLLSKAATTNKVYLSNSRHILILARFQLNCLCIKERVAFSLILSEFFFCCWLWSF